MTHLPLISVTMPVYNAERYVAQAVESILAQTFGDFEFLILNDGSSDRCLQILQKYAAKDNRIRLSSQENRGIGATRNQLLTQAQGELIAVMDADDVAFPDRFALQVAFLQRHPEVLCVGGAHEFVDEAGRLLFRKQDPLEDATIQPLALRGETPINHPSAMMRRAAVLQVGGYDSSLAPAEDLDLFLKLGEIGKLANLPETVLQYRQHSQSASERKQLEQNRFKQIACERAWQRRGIAGEFTAMQPWRPVDKPSLHAFWLEYGWKFFVTGQRSAAIAYGIKAVRTLPLEIEGWKLLLSALIKPLPRQNAHE